MRWTAMLLLLLAVPLLPGQALAQDTGEIVGTVTESQTLRLLEGASVVVEGTPRLVFTGPEGRYVISDVEPGTYVLRTEMLGYAQSEQTVTVAAGESVTADFEMEVAAISLEGVVAIGYGSVQRRDVTGSVASVGSEELRRVPSRDVRESLQGRLPGMDIRRESGSPNSDMDWRVRGTRSLTADNNPLIIIDGAQFGRLEDLNPSDIESIEVLKDAAATAIYGSRGANGVILVTTKNGGAGGTNISASSYVGMTDITSYPRINTGQEYVDLKREAFRTAGEWSSEADDDKIFSPRELENIAGGVSTDFRDLIFRDATVQSHQVGVSTGSANTRVYLSLGAFQENGILRSDEVSRYALRFNLEHALSDQWTVGTNSQVTYYDRDRRDDPLNIANKINPLTPAFDGDGDLIVYPNDGKDISPLADEESDAYANNELETIAVPSLFAEFTPLANLTIRSTLGANVVGRRTGIFRSPNTIDQNGAASAAEYETHNSRNLSWENVLTYQKALGDHSLGLTGVASYITSQRDSATALGRNQLLSSQLFYGLANATEGVAINSGYVESTLLSYAARLNYDWRGRYLLTFTGRFDGSSILSPGNRWAFFPGVAAAWRLSDESFLSDASFIDDLKLRVSYGVSGNDAVDPFSTQAALEAIPFSFGESLAQGFTFGEQLGNEDLKWELSATTNIGLDAVLWDNRVTATIDLYQTNTSDLLLERFLPVSSGVSSIIQNVGETRNRGIELSLNTNNIQTPDFSWSSHLTFFKNNEEIVELVGAQDDVGNEWFIGHPVDVFYDYEKTGIWQEEEAEAAAQFGQEPGEIKVRDQNGDGAIRPDDDRIVLGSERPDWSGNLTNNVRWRDFDLAASVFVRWGQMMQYGFYDSYKPDGVENGANVDYWTPENPTNDFPRPNSRFPKTNYLYYRSLTFEDASFIKLRDVTVGFTVPESLAQQLRVGSARFYITGRNLARITKVDDYDPERGGDLSDPMTRSFVAGVDLSF